MDGFSENKDVVVIGATNRAKFLDAALLRSGRFDTKLAIKLPT
jgi:transitional endoplasmic reticulum ATPase